MLPARCGVACVAYYVEKWHGESNVDILLLRQGKQEPMTNIPACENMLVLACNFVIDMWFVRDHRLASCHAGIVTADYIVKRI